MSYIYELYYNYYLLEDKVDELRNCQEVLDLEEKLKNLLNENFKIYKEIKFLLVDKLTNLMEDERELAFNRGIKVGMELQEYFATLIGSESIYGLAFKPQIQHFDYNLQKFFKYR